MAKADGEIIHDAPIEADIDDDGQISISVHGDDDEVELAGVLPEEGNGAAPAVDDAAVLPEEDGDEEAAAALSDDNAKPVIKNETQTGSSSGGKKKKIVIGVAVLGSILGIGLGLGLGLRNSNSNDDSDEAASSSTSPGSAGSPITSVVPTETYDAVVIGAGWAGIRATETLLNAGITNLLVLEANNYVGGRAKSINEDGTINNANLEGAGGNIPYDIGCEWLYNTGNDMEETLLDKGYLDGAILDGDKDTAIPLSGMIFQQKRDKETGDLTTEVLEDKEAWVDEIWGGFLQFREERLDDDLKGLSYAEAIDSYIEKWEWTDDESLDFLDMIEEIAEMYYTADSTQLDIDEVEFFPAGYSIDTHYTSVPGKGFGNIAAKYVEGFDIVDEIVLDATVVEINSEGENVNQPKVVYIEDGVTKAVMARTVLVTASLGVLKAGNINFVPILPSWKQDVIDAMGFGVVNKCVMSWNNDEDYVWPGDQLWFLLQTPDEDTSGQWTTFSNPSNFKGVPSLTAWIGGQEAIEAEQKTDDEILETVMNNLKAMFPSIREPDNVIISRWGQEEHVRGTYSFPVPGRNFYDDADLLQRRLGRVYFAGEATGSGWATTMGAWNTGNEAAEAMIEMLEEEE